MKQSIPCRVCGAPAVEIFRIPKSKLTGHPIPDAPDDCIYCECTVCRFCFTDILDAVDQESVYDESYWNNQDTDWSGRVHETLRLVMFANTLLHVEPWKLEILDFGSGMGVFVHAAREKLSLQAWGHDIIEPKYGKEFFLKTLPEGKFDIVVSCEVLEHLPFPQEILQGVLRSLKPGGIFTFQTAYYNPATCGRDWWYVGPANGHVSLYSVGAFDVLFHKLGGERRLLWNDYPGMQAWQIGSARCERKTVSHEQDSGKDMPGEHLRPMSKVCDAADFFSQEYLDVTKGELYEAPYLHRKQWEFAMVFLALKRRGMLDTTKIGLSMGSGNERVLYSISRHVKHVTATDLYDNESLWDCAKAANPDEYIRKSKPFPVDDAKLSALNMDMRNLAFEDNTFDFAYSCCALEHIGENADFLQHLNEVYRVLKDGGVYVMTTEFTFENETIPIPNNYLFSAEHLNRLIAESMFTPEKHFDARITEQSANFPIPAQVNDPLLVGGNDFMKVISSSGAMPHVQLLHGNHPFTSCLLVLEKDAGKRSKDSIVFDGLTESRSYLQARAEQYGTTKRLPFLSVVRHHAASVAPHWMKRVYHKARDVISS